MDAVGDTGFDWADIVDDVVERSGGQTATAADVLSIRRSLRILLERWNGRGYNLWRVGEAMITAGGISPEIGLPDDIDDIIGIEVRQAGTDGGTAALVRRSEAEYKALSLKATRGQPTLYCLRRSEPPCLLIYPIGGPVNYDLQITYIRRPGRFARYDYVDDDTIAGRWLEALVTGLAAERAKKTPPYNEPLIARLTGEAGVAERLAQEADRGRQRFRYRIA